MWSKKEYYDFYLLDEYSHVNVEDAITETLKIETKEKKCKFLRN